MSSCEPQWRRHKRCRHGIAASRLALIRLNLVAHSGFQTAEASPLPWKKALIRFSECPNVARQEHNHHGFPQHTAAKPKSRRSQEPAASCQHAIPITTRVGIRRNVSNHSAFLTQMDTSEKLPIKDIRLRSRHSSEVRQPGTVGY